MIRPVIARALCALACIQGPAHAASAEVVQAEKARSKPLQRCDQLADKAQAECLEKARQRIVEARRKRESSGSPETSSAKSPAPERKAKGDKSAPAK